MNIIKFLQYVIFNKDGQRTTVLDEYRKHFKELQEKRWDSYNKRMQSV